MNTKKEFVTKETVQFTKEERDKIWGHIASTSFFSLFPNKTYKTLRDTESYKVEDGNVLIPYSDGKGTYKMKLKTIEKVLEQQAGFDAVVSLS